MSNRIKTENESEYLEKVVKISRVNKVVKGGKRLRFRAFVICGDRKGNVGLGLGKSKEVPSAIKKAFDVAKNNFVSIYTDGDTIPHPVEGKSGSSKVVIKPANPGTGVIAGGSLRIILESLGLKDVVGKSLGSRNPLNLALASIDALKKCKLKEIEENERGVKISSSYRGDK